MGTVRVNTAQWLENQKRWQIQVQKDGVRRTFTSSTPGRKGREIANKKADRWLENATDGENTKVNVLLDDYLASKRKTTSKSNCSKLESISRVWIRPRIGNKPICKLTEQDLQDILDSACADGLSKKSLLNIQSVISQFLKYCRRRNVTKLIPENIAVPKSARYVGKKILQPDKLKVLFSSDKMLFRKKYIPDPYVDAYRFQVLTGLRPGELLGLMWQDIDGNVLHLRRSINNLGEETRGKNENAIRDIYLNKLELDILKKLSKHKDSDYVFGGLSLNQYEYKWRRSRKSIDLGDITLYELRHTFVSVVKNLPEGKIKPMVGHSKNMDTFGIYSHEIQGELKSTAKEIGEIFSSYIK